jgi:hypothetical protein
MPGRPHPKDNSANRQSDIVKCPACGEENFAFAQFCIGCGAPMDEPTAEVEPEKKSAKKIDNDPWEVPQESEVQEHHGSAREARARWEARLGLGLLVLVVIFALFTWQRSTSHSDAYYEGIRAQEKQDWDAALSGFRRAEDAPGAAERAEVAQKNVNERNGLYADGVAALNRGEWEAAISALQRIQDIQPRYGDSAELLAKAREQALAKGLAGIAYLVGSGGSGSAAPGLYVRDGEGKAILLPGSDGRSSIHATSNDGGMIVYDRPGKDSDYFPEDGAVGEPAGRERPGRIPVMATLPSAGSDGVVTTIPLPQLDSGGTGVFSQKGLWWYSSQPSKGSFGYEVFYYSSYLRDTLGVVRVSDLQSGRRVVAVDPPRSRVVVGETSGDPRGDGRTTRLYLADEVGGNRRLVQTAQGDVYQASVSRDGKWLLYITERYTASIERTVLAVPLEGGGEARQLDTLTWSGFEVDRHLSAAYVPSKGGSDRVIVDKVDVGLEQLIIYDLDNRTYDLIWRVPIGSTHQPDLSAFSQDGTMLASRQQYERAAAVQLLWLEGSGVVEQQQGIEVRASQVVKTRFSPRGDFVVATAENLDGIDRGVTQEVYTARIGADRTLGPPERIAAAQLPYDREMPPVALPSEGSLLAYVDKDQDLHAVFYDGAGDVVIEGNVRAVWNLSEANDLGWWR